MRDDTKQINLNIGSVIQIVFIILKLTNLIHWSWLWVLSPLWISAIITLLVYTISVCIIKEKKKYESNEHSN
nr:MAG TPA: transmembrane protein [Caudoviricetes sp.]